MSHPFGEPHPTSLAEKSKKRQRRYQSRSDEEIWDEMDKKGLSYRLGWPELPQLPVKVITPTTRLPQEYMHREMVSKILGACKISVMAIRFDLRVPYWEDPKNQNSYMTLWVLLDTEKYDRIHLETAVKDLRQYFKGAKDGADTLKIELLDYRAYVGLWTLPLGPKEIAIADQWPAVLDKLITELAKLNESWLCIELCHRGLHNDPKRSPLTAVISTASATDDHWWKDTLPILRTRINSPFILQYEVMYTRSLYSMDSNWKSAPGSHVSDDSYARVLRMGPSIGIAKDPKHAGTAGGLVTLGKKGSYALTNFHVASDDRIDRIVKGNTLPFNSEVLQDKPQTFMSPSDVDDSAYVAYLRSEKNKIENSRDPSRPALKELIDKYAANLAKTQASREFGTLAAESGRISVKAPMYMTDDKTGKPKPPPSGKERAAREYVWLMDWALIELAKGRSMMNFTSKAPFTGPNARKTGIVPGQPAEEWTSLNAGACDLRRHDVHVAKYGRSSGWSQGQINPTIVALNPGGEYVRIAKAYGYTEEWYGHCWSVDQRFNTDGAFITSGDSGSICVHDPTGTWLGLIFAASGIGSGLMLPIDLVFREIERVTSEKVTDPKYVVVP